MTKNSGWQRPAGYGEKKFIPCRKQSQICKLPIWSFHLRETGCSLNQARLANVLHARHDLHSASSRLLSTGQRLPEVASVMLAQTAHTLLFPFPLSKCVCTVVISTSRSDRAASRSICFGTTKYNQMYRICNSHVWPFHSPQLSLLYPSEGRGWVRQDGKGIIIQQEHDALGTRGRRAEDGLSSICESQWSRMLS